MTFEEWWDSFSAWAQKKIQYEDASRGWKARDAEVAALTAERDAARAQTAVALTAAANRFYDQTSTYVESGDTWGWHTKDYYKSVLSGITEDHQDALDKYVEGKTADLRGKLERVKGLASGPAYYINFIDILTALEEKE